MNDGLVDEFFFEDDFLVSLFEVFFCYEMYVVDGGVGYGLLFVVEVGEDDIDVFVFFI